jgi:Cys-rich repeat protein
MAIPSGCTTDGQCGLGGICQNGICFVTSTCPAGVSNYECCRQAVKKACRHRGGSHSPHGDGHECRKKGKKRCRENFGNT